MSKSDFKTAERYFCKACDVGQGILRSASAHEKEAFERFIQEHAEHNRDAAEFERLRTLLVTKRGFR